MALVHRRVNSRRSSLRRRRRGRRSGFPAARQATRYVHHQWAVLASPLEARALVRRPVVWQPRDAVLPEVQHPTPYQRPAAFTQRREVVVGERQVFEVAHHRQPAHQVRHLSVELVPGKVELLHPAEAPERKGDGFGDLVEARVEHGGLHQKAGLVGEATAEAVVEEEDLDEGVGGVADGAGDGAREGIVGEGEVGHRGAAEVAREWLAKVVVEEENVEAERTKIWGGTTPAKELKRRSRNKSLLRGSTLLRKDPVSLLLLRSSS